MAQRRYIGVRFPANEALQIMGGTGFTTKHDIERHFRDARGDMTAVGTNEIMRLVIQREAYKELSKSACNL